ASARYARGAAQTARAVSRVRGRGNSRPGSRGRRSPSGPEHGAHARTRGHERARASAAFAVPRRARGAGGVCRRARGLVAYRSLHEFVGRLEAAGELVRVKRELDPRLEIAALAAALVRRGGPALLCENVRGSRFPLLIGAYAGARRMAWALGVDDLAEHARAI